LTEASAVRCVSQKPEPGQKAPRMAPSSDPQIGTRDETVHSRLAELRKHAGLMPSGAKASLRDTQAVIFRAAQCFDLRRLVRGLQSAHQGAPAAEQRHGASELGIYHRVELWGFEPQTSCMP
jgi:hypothetical protein